jgi:hypothetical protein
MATSFADFAENATPFLEDSFYNISLIAEDLASGFENLLDTLGVASNSKSKMEQRRADRQELKDLRRNRKAAEMSGNTDLIAVLDKQIKNKEQAISLNKEADKQDAAANSLIMDAATEASALTKGLAAVATLPFGGLGSSMLIDSAKSDVTGMAESKDQYANNAAKLRAEADALAADTALQNKTKYELLANSLDTIVKRINDSSNSLNTKVPLGQR